jgi:hypothetical protein
VQHYPNNILRKRLYLGDANHATNEYVVRNLKITHIANITDCVPRMFEDVDYMNQKIEYLQIVVADRENESIIDHFPDFYCFLEEAFNSNFRSEMPDRIKGMTHHHLEFEKKKSEIKWKSPIHEQFNIIANSTVS